MRLIFGRASNPRRRSLLARGGDATELGGGVGGDYHADPLPSGREQSPWAVAPEMDGERKEGEGAMDDLASGIPAGNREGGKKPRGIGRALLRLLVFFLAAGLLGLAGVVGIFLYYGRDLPTFDAVTDYDPPQVSRVFDRNGEPVAEFFHERRTVVPIDKIPKVLTQAVVAAEDAAFYQHAGLDYAGIARALLMDVRQMRLAQGASTITQQVVKNLVLSPERSVARKVKEAILARRLEQNLSKDEILSLYLNHIYFGHGRYGVEEAAQFYFGKSVTDLSLGEAAMLAGLPQSPGRLSPLRNPKRAKARQTYVLEQMVKNGFITAAQARQEIAKPIAAVGREISSPGAYYVEEVRRHLVETYGEKLVYEGALRVEIAMDSRLQAIADRAVRAGLEDVERRAGFRAPELSVADKVLEQARAKLFDSGNAPAGEDDDEPLGVPTGWDFSGATAESVASVDALAQAARRVALEPGAELVAPVASVSDSEAVLDLGSAEGAIAFESMKWARPYGPTKWTAAPKRAGDVLAAGQLVRVRVLAAPEGGSAGLRAGGREPASAPDSSKKDEAKKKPARWQLVLVPVPQVQGALVALEPKPRHVVALVGGYDFAASHFNRATQARRQPGSCFKPFVYAAALSSGRFTTASILNDAPDVFRDPWTGKEWKPQNYEKDVFEGPMTLREALSKSKNTVSVRLIEAVGPEAVIDLARRAGIGSELPENLTLGLGTGEVTPLELANGFATFAALGVRADPILLTRVVDRNGKVLEEHHAVPEETIPPGVAFIATSLMQSVVESGTGARAQELRRPVAGKTGTASGNRDAWFAGFTPGLVASAWVGYDDHAPLGRSETGGRAALPIWLEFMRGAHEGAPVAEFEKPADVEEVRIDPQSGLRAHEDGPGRLEVFVEGTAPTEYATPPGQVDPRKLFLEDRGGEW
ncbi:MAG: penicillin-binding protein 1A [Myxococcales bacterium]|jgi:penicillin-binding protein 1A